jgi:hypothetical protein
MRQDIQSWRSLSDAEFAEMTFWTLCNKGQKFHGLVDFRMSTALTAFPFQSVWTFPSLLKTPRSTIYNHLHRENFALKYLGWVSYTLDESTKWARAQMVNSVLTMITEACHQSLRSALTGDESGFRYSTDYEQMWLRRREIAPASVRHIISTPEVLITMFWSSLCFRAIATLRDRKGFTARYFRHKIVA